MENGEIAELWAPMTMQANRIRGLMPVASARAGTRGNRAGHTTPRVLEKKLMTAPITLNIIGISHTGRLEPVQDASRSMVPASMATLISIPTPQIRRARAITVKNPAPRAAAMAQEGIGLAFTYRSCSRATPDVNLLSIAPEGKYVDLALAYPEGYRSKAARALGNLFHEHFS